jgi:hypothetical protein
VTKNLLQIFNLFKFIIVLLRSRNRRLRGVGHAWRSQNPLLHAVIEQNPIGKKPLRRTRMWWGNVIKKDVEQMGGYSNWRLSTE